MKYWIKKWARLLPNQKGLAFTLAEIIIVVGIIGIIAEITIPNLVTNFKKQFTVSKLQQFYSTMSQVLRLSEIDNGELINWNIGPVYYSDGSAEFNKYFRPYLNISKYCGVSYEGRSNNECCPYITKGKDGSSRASSASYATFFVLSDGTLVKFLAAYGTDSVIAEENTGYEDLPYFIMQVDINGTKLPNAYGRDVFTFFIYRMKGLQPSGYFVSNRGVTRTSLLNSCNANTAISRSDSGCAGIIMLDGWKISDDYSW